MRLRGYIAFELLTYSMVLGSLGVGGLWLAGRYDSGRTQEAQAATSAPPTRSAARHSTAIEPTLSEHGTTAELTEEVSDAGVAQDADSVPAASIGSFGGVADEELLAPLRTSPISSVRFNRGGSSISLRIDFENGARAAFKPRQTNWQSVPRREIVAFRINRLLGLSSVPPALGRRFKADKILAALDRSSVGFKPRLRVEMTQKAGWVTGELSWWIPVIRRAKIDGFDIDSMEGIVSWKRYLRVNRKIPQKHQSLLQQISEMVLFDFVINNPDRWSGGNARVNDERTELYFMDNTMSFGTSKIGHRKARIYFERCQIFSRSLVQQLRTLSEETIRETLSKDVEPFDVFLSDAEIEAIMGRRDVALRYIDKLVRRYGEEKVLAFP